MKRLLYLDNLKVCLTMLVIFHHAGQAYGDGGAWANELPGVRGGVVEKGRVYRLVFLECTCKLCKKGYVTTPLLCECSRQSVIYSLQCLWKEKHFTVTLCHSILRGGTDCEMRIEVGK